MSGSKKTTERQRPLTLDETVAKLECERDHLFFTRYFFKHRQNIKFRVNWHHQLVADVVEDVMQGRRKNVVINVPPGGSKTEMVVVNGIARGLAINPWARFLHLSYSDDLALLNSQTAREVITSDEYQRFWPMAIADDAKAKKRWNVMVNGRKAGGVYAVSLGGQITGFRAGHMIDGFQGAILIDDPLKPEDSFSESKLNQANRKLITTVKSRKANPNTPIILIMQRISEKDPSAFVIANAVGGEWDHIIIPSVIDEEYVAKLAPKYQSGLERDAEGRFSYWPYKEPIGELLQMESGNGIDQTGARMSRHVFASQYQQNPVAIGGNIIKGEWFERYTILPKIKRRFIYADTAQKTKERNDFSVFECWGLGEDNKMYLIDMIRGKWEAPELERRAVEFYQKQNAIKSSVIPWVKNHTTAEYGAVGGLRVEDKSSGTGLIQSIRFKNAIPIKAVERKSGGMQDKLTRLMDVLGWIEARFVCLPQDAPFTADFVQECEAFTADDSHAYDDQIDPMIDAVNELLSTGNKLKQWENII